MESQMADSIGSEVDEEVLALVFSPTGDDFFHGFEGGKDGMPVKVEKASEVS